MNFSDKDILLASLLGSKTMEDVPRFAVVENELEKHVGYPIPFLPFKNKWKADKSDVENQFFPLKLKRTGTNDEWFTLPFEPMISIAGKNNIIKRSIAKAPHFVGTIKEHWSQDDYSINITGTLFGDNEIGDYQSTFPRTYFEKLRDQCLSPTGLDVQCDLFQLLGIQKIVVEDFTFPFSKGENVQAYTMKAISDYSADFLLEIQD